MSVYVQFSDENKTEVISYFGSPQDPDVWIDQGAVDENDELRLLFVAKAPPGTFDNINP
jgi:hypothetical protein